MLAGTTALYTAKIRRGGMGTGMPYWGSIFTEEELTALVDYVWTFSLTHRE
jgi:mono/diheme cytochrome c family protein